MRGIVLVHFSLYFRCSPHAVHSCPEGHYCRVLDDLTETVCCPGAEQGTLAGGTIGSSLVSIMKPDYSRGVSNNNVDYGALLGPNGATSSISSGAFGSFGTSGSVPVVTNPYLGNIGSLYAGNLSQSSSFNGLIGTGISPAVVASGLIGTGASVNSQSSVGSGVSVDNINYPVGTGVSIQPSVANTFGNAVVLKGLGSGIQTANSMTPNAATGTMR